MIRSPDPLPLPDGETHAGHSKLAIAIERGIFASRWLLAPLYSPITDQDRVRALAALLAKMGYKLVPLTPNTIGTRLWPSCKIASRIQSSRQEKSEFVE
jgi:hypothetical protein